jgi:hypothetical protein
MRQATIEIMKDLDSDKISYSCPLALVLLKLAIFQIV